MPSMLAPRSIGFACSAERSRVLARPYPSSATKGMIAQFASPSVARLVTSRAGAAGIAARRIAAGAAAVAAGWADEDSNKGETSHKSLDDKGGATALRTASQRGHMAVVEALLAAGAGVGAEVEYGSTFLHEACKSGNAVAVEVLLRAGVDKEARNK
ncbi:Cortactin-binding protein 2, partial [Tetrabaena socialis]